MKEFRINKTDTIVCEWGKTRNGFKHTVTYLRDGNEVADAKVNYLNRTWESYEYETAIHKLLDKMELPDAKKKHILDICAGKAHAETEEMFGTVANIAKLGEVFANTKEEKNKWKKRMLKAGLSGFDLPEDWDTLSEDEKEKRLNLVIEELKKKKQKT